MKYIHMITIIFLLLLQSMSPLLVHAETVDTELSALYQEFEETYHAGKPDRAAMIATKALEKAEETFGSDHPIMATSLNNYAAFYYKQGQYAQAEPLFKRVQAITEKALGMDNIVVASTLNNLASLYYKQGEFTQAKPLFKRVLTITEKTLGPDNLAVAMTLNNLALLYYEQGEYAQAEPLYKRALAINEKSLEPNHPDVATSLNNLAALYKDQGEYALAEPLYKRALTIIEKARGDDHPDVATTLNNLAMFYYSQGRYVQADPLFKRALAIREKTLGKNHPDVATSLNSLAGFYLSQSEYAQAKPLFKRALAIWEKTLGPNHPHVATSLNNIASLHEEQGEYAQAKSLFKRALAIREKVLGPDHPDVATSLNNIASLHQEQGEYAQAEPFFKRALAINEKTLGKNHPDVAMNLNNLAGLYQNRGQYAQAEPLVRRALAITEKALGPDHPDVSNRLHNLASFYKGQGQYAQAEPLYKRALSITENTLGPEHPEIAMVLNGLAGLYKDQGEYAQAEPLYKRALAIREKSLGQEHRDVAISLGNLATLYQDQGEYVQAKQLYKRALEIMEKSLGTDHPGVSTSLNNLARLYQDQGQYAQAEKLYKRALEISEKSLGPDHPDVAVRLGNLATIYHDQGDYEQAETLHKRELAIQEKALGQEHPGVALSLGNLANIYETKGEYAQAEPLYKRALAIREKALGPDHPDVATNLNNFAGFYHNQRRYEQAKPLLKRALAIREKALGPEHPDVAISLSNLGVYYVDQKKYEQAKTLYKRALAIREKALGTDHPDVASSLMNLAVLNDAIGEDAQAETLYKRAIAIRKKSLGPDHPDVASSLGLLASLYRDQGKYVQAEPLYKRALAIMEKALGSSHPDIGELLNETSKLYNYNNESIYAKRLYKRAMGIRYKSVQNNTQQTDVENVFTDALNERCGSEQMSLLGYPDMYLKPSELAACEIAFIIDPDQYAKQYETRLVAHSLNKSTNLDADLFEVRDHIAILLKRKQQQEPTVVDLAISGDPISFYNLIIQKMQLSDEQRKSMEELIGKSMVEVFFGKFTEPDSLVTDIELMHAVEKILFQAQNMSGFFLEVATKNIHNALARSHADNTVAEIYLSMPVRLRKLLLSLASITKVFSAEEIAVMRAIQYSHLERLNYKKYWVKRRFSLTMQDYPEADFIWLSRGMSEAQHGEIATWPTIALLNKLQSLAQSKPYLQEKYASYFPDVDYDKILNIDTESLRKRYIEAIKSHSLTGLTEFETSLLIADIRHATTHTFRDSNHDSDFFYINKITADNTFVIDLLRNQVDPLIDFSWKTQLTEEWSHASTGIDDLIEHISSNIDSVCELYNEEMCDRLWRNIDLSDFGINNNYSINGECFFSPSIQLMFQRKLRAGHIDDRFAIDCSLDSFEITLDRDSSNVISLLTQTSSRDYLLLNQSFVKDGGGLIARHIHHAMGDKRRSPVPFYDYHLALSSNDKSWGFFNAITNNQAPTSENSEASSKILYLQLATIYSMIGNHERSLLSQVNDLEKLSTKSDLKLGVLLTSISRLKHYSRNSGMPEPYINYLMEKYIRENHKLFTGLESGANELKFDYRSQINRNNYSNYENAILEYILPGDLQSVFASLDDMGLDDIGLVKNFPRVVGGILSLSDADQDMLCADEDFQELAYPVKGMDLGRLIGEYFLKIGSDIQTSAIDAILYFEYANFDIRCRLAGLGLKSDYYSNDQLISNFIIQIADKVIPYIESGASFTDTRYSTTLAMFSSHSYVSGSTTGLIAPLVALKHSFELMADSYIYRNSATLRLKMPDIETVIVNTAKALRDIRNDNEKQTAIFSRLMRRIETLAASAHAVFVSDRTRARMLDVKNKTIVEVAGGASITSNTSAYNQMTEYFHESNKSLAASKTVSDAIVNKARFGEHGIQAIPRFYKAAAQIEKAIALPKEVFPTSNNSVLLNILSNGEQIFFQLLDDKGRYISDTLDIQASLASRLKERITRSTKITDDDVKLGCEGFASLHQIIKPLIKGYSRLVVVPSVNLLPIPTELIVGTACDSSDATIIHTADVLGAIELMRSDKSIDLPQSFVGIGNPSLPIESNQIKIAAVDGGDKEIVRNLSAIDEFKPLPDAEEEIQEIAEIFRDTSIFTAAEGSIMKGLDAAQINLQKGKNSAIVLATHGVGLDLGQGFELPSLLSVEEGKSTLIGATAVQQFDLDGSIVVLSACDTAAGLYEKPEMMFTGFVESFADAQSSFIVASLLPVLSQASKQHTVAFFRALKNGDIWQAARAGKKALSNATDALPFVYIYP